MPSIISHAVGAFWVNKAFFDRKNTIKISILVCISAMIPDADFIGYKLGIPYNSLFGHRGFTHSIFFAILWSLIVYYFSFRKKIGSFWVYFLIIFIATLSHGLLDGCTSGGEGVAFFSPFSNHRYFFPFREIRVSPLGVKSFFSERGIVIMLSEIKYIWIPSFIIYLVSKLINWIKNI